jgi:hypothetical protein
MPPGRKLHRIPKSGLADEKIKNKKGGLLMVSNAKREAHEARELVVLERSDLIVRDNAGKPSGLTASGLQLVERLAKDGSTQNYIAGKLSVPQHVLKRLIGRAEEESPVRLAWERGRALHEQEVVRRMLEHGKKNVVGLIFYAKAKLGWKENEPPPAVQNNIMLTMPQPMTKEQYYKSLGLEGPVDSRVLHDVTTKDETAHPGVPEIPFYQRKPEPTNTGDEHG